MRPDLVILDFDGTFTDVEAEAVPFLEAYRADFEAIAKDAGARWDAVRAEIEANPNDFGWEHEGRIVAPSHADPYIMATTTAQRLLDLAGILRDPKERAAALDQLFRLSYARAANVFRPDAAKVIAALLETGLPIFVVTNSHTDAVMRKIEALGVAGSERMKVFGNARKFMLVDPESIDARYRALPETLAIDGLSRPIYLRRGHYYALLARIAAETGVEPSRTLVVGDIFELDLALPASLGCSVHLVTRAKTPAYERRAVAAFARGRTSAELSGMLEWLAE
jgi:phosphoglycolate phosphatase-like HAD superfamily hydrolase